MRANVINPEDIAKMRPTEVEKLEIVIIGDNLRFIIMITGRVYSAPLN